MIIHGNQECVCRVNCLPSDGYSYVLIIYKVWERAEEFVPERFGLDGPVPNESNTDFRYLFLLVPLYYHFFVFGITLLT